MIRRAIVFGALAAAAIMLPATAATWLDRLPADDPGLVPPGRSAPMQGGLPMTSLPLPGGLVGSVYASLSGIVAAMATLPAVTRQAVWEVSYMFGFNICC